MGLAYDATTWRSPSWGKKLVDLYPTADWYCTRDCEARLANTEWYSDIHGKYAVLVTTKGTYYYDATMNAINNEL